MSEARTYYVGLQLLDRQLVDRQGRLVGKVDDLELEGDVGGPLYISAILSGPGVLAQRLGRKYGRWVQRVHRLVAEGTPRGQGVDPARIPFWRVVEIGSGVELAAEEEELGTHSTEQWVADHLIARLPGGRHAPE
jgi:sporulation protein YlmC with PRC-barrel domain